MAADTLPLGGKRVEYRAFSRYEVASVVMEVLLMVGGFSVAVVMEILLMVGGFSVDGGAELTLVDVNIDIQEGDMGLGGVPGEVERIVT